jgi:hypothetical protein
MDKETLLKPRLPERDVDIPDVGTVRVRGLSRAEALGIQALGDDTAAVEHRILLLGLVDPKLTAEDVAEFYAAAPAGEIDPIVSAVVELSGLAEGASKSGVPQVRS